MKWTDNAISVDAPKKPKKITGTWFPTVLGFDPWKTPFEAWCRCTRTYEKPFAGNKFTNAGEIIEPKVFAFLKKSMGFGDRLVTPTDVYGADPFKKTWGDFFHDVAMFGGMWDALIYNEEKTAVEYVVEVKTVQIDGRSGSLEERWKDGEAPHYQALQAALYAHLLGIDKVMMVSVSLEDAKGDYEHPENVVPSFANGNTYIDEFSISERYPNFDLYVETATKWWNDYVLKGKSPAFDEKKDADILKALRTNSLSPDTDVESLIKEGETLKADIDAVSATIADKEKRLKAINEVIKSHAMEQFRDGDKSVSVKGTQYEWVLSRSEKETIDKTALKTDGLLDRYTTKEMSYRLTTTKIKEDKKNV